MMEAVAVRQHHEVLARLARVTDPELDEPVTTLGFITDVAVDEDRVAIQFRLPTYWCAANFAFLMAEDMRREVAALDWVRRVDVVLNDHMYADTINNGILSGATFHEAFGNDAAADLDELRLTFNRKSFQRRQELLLRALLEARQAPEQLVSMTVDGLRGACGDDVLSGLAARYLDRRDIPGAFDGRSLAFVDVQGRPLSAADAMRPYLRSLRNVAVNVEFNGALCRGLLAARFNEAQPDDREPTLRDFMLQALSRQTGEGQGHAQDTPSR